ncbi:ribosylnicotinamide kinase [Salix suchowensis]|nr:ribosylnicotinamide kinase [Salix suchowensis]
MAQKANSSLVVCGMGEIARSQQWFLDPSSLTCKLRGAVMACFYIGVYRSVTKLKLSKDRSIRNQWRPAGIVLELRLRPVEKLPVDPEYGFADWDNAPGAIDWDRMATFLSDLKRTGVVPDDHQSFDLFNTTTDVPVNSEIITSWKTRSKSLVSEYLDKHGENLVWAIVDGFLLYWDKGKARGSNVHHTWLVVRSYELIVRLIRATEGDVWRDPPHYWEKIIWPAYKRAHSVLFEGEDTANGELNGEVEGLILFESTKAEMKDIIDAVMNKVVDVSQAPKQ